METGQKSNSRRGFYIEVGCPGCGGELEIDADFFVTSCSHCGTPLRLVLPESPPAYILPNKLSLQDVRIKIDRQLKTQGLPLTGQSLHYKQIYYPYWKIEAMLLRCRNRKEKISVQLDDSTREEIIDYKKNSLVNLTPYHMTVAASMPLGGVPDSIGIRGQSLKVTPFKSSGVGEEFDIMEVRRSPEEVLKTIELSVSRLNTIELAEFGENLTKLYNPETSLIFFPFCIAEDYEGEGYRRYVLDGLTGRILSIHDSLSGESMSESEREFDDSGDDIRLELPNINDGLENATIKFGAVEVQLHRCKVCGVDLPARQSCIYICNNCHELTCLDKEIFSVPEILAADSDDKDSLYFPFWSYQINKGKYFGSLDETDRILIPAFNIPNFEALFRLSCRVTTAASKLKFEPIELLNEQFTAVEITASVGKALANVVFYRYELEKTKRLPGHDLKLSTQELSLCFIPFKPESYFFVDSALNSISFEKKLVTS